VAAAVAVLATLASCGDPAESCWGLDCSTAMTELEESEVTQLCEGWYRDIEPDQYRRFRCEEEILGPVGSFYECEELITEAPSWCDTTLAEFYDCFEPWYRLSCEELIELGGKPLACVELRNFNSDEPCD
jgi:hypothetical protein